MSNQPSAGSGDMPTRNRTVAAARWLWPAVGVSTVLVPVTFILGMRADSAEVRAGAEPLMSGILFSAPFVVLLLVQVAGAIGAHIADTRRGVTTSLSFATAASALLTALVGWQVGVPAVRDGSAQRLAIAAVVALALLLPLVPPWLIQVRGGAFRSAAR